jgi:hypothetical protein
LPVSINTSRLPVLMSVGVNGFSMVSVGRIASAKA